MDATLARVALRVNTEVATELAPFVGWRFAESVPLEAVLAPPYDVIGPEAQKRYLHRHPHNIVRLILPQTLGEEASTSIYERAAALMRTWIAQGVLQPDPRPAFYVLRQTFHLPEQGTLSRIGIIGRFALRPWGQGIYPHERTFPTAKADRLALLRATGTHFSPIFALYSDPEGITAHVLAGVTAQPPTAAFTDDDGVTHVLWRVDNPARVAELQAFLSNRVYYVADGHHRYETALAYQRWRREKAPPAPPGQAYDYALLYAAPMEQPALRILPTHRAVRAPKPTSRDHVLAVAARAYTVEPVQDDATLLQWMAARQPGEPAIGLVFPTGPAYILRLRWTASPVLRMLGTMPPFVAHLTVFQLHLLILEPALGIPDDPDAQKQWVTYSPDAARLVQEVRAGRWDLVALVAPTGLHQLRAIAEAGLVAPPKATYFYPKLPSGLVMYRVDEPS